MSAGPNRGVSVRAARYERGWAAMVLVAIAVHLVLAWLGREPGLLTGQDDAEYITLAKSLRQGGYNELFRVDAPVHRTYPPGYPLLLAAWGGAFGDGFDVLVGFNVLCSALSLGVLFLCLRRVTDVWLAALAVAVVAVNPEIVRFAGAVRSEVPYLLATLVALYGLLRAQRSARWLGLAMLAALFAAAIRTVGTTLVVAIALHWLLERRWKALVPVLGVALLAGVWLAWTARGPEQYVGSSYVAELRTIWEGIPLTGPLLERAPDYIRGYIANALPAQLAVPTVPGTPIDNVVTVSILLVCLLAGLVVLLRHWRPAGLYLVAYAALLSVWLFALERFLTPVIPLLVAALLMGAAALARPLGQRARWMAPLALAIVLGVGGAFRSGVRLAAHVRCDRDGAFPDAACLTDDQRSYFAALAWMETRLPADATLLAAKSGALWLYTGLRTVSYEASLDRGAAEFLPFVREQGGRWILLGSLHNRELESLAPLLHANCDTLALAASFPPRTYLFRISDEGEPADRAACAALDAYLADSADRDFGGTPWTRG